MTETDIMKSFEEFQKSGQEITVERITLEELNQMMIENGLEPFEKKDRKPSNYRSMDCELIGFLANANGVGGVTGADIVYVNQYMVNNGFNSLPLGGVIDPTTGRPIEIIRYGFVSAAYGNTEGFRLDYSDEDIVADYILGFICE